MFRTRTLMAFLLVTMVVGLVLTGSGTALAQNQLDVFWVAYYSGGVTSTTAAPGTNVQIINTGASGGNLCADIYVFDPREELKECCHCTVTPDGLLTLTMAELTNNPANGIFSTTGVIKIVSDSGTNCNEASPVPTPELRSWIVNPNNGRSITESEFEATPLSAAELSNLKVLCGAVKNQTGPGVCAAANPACD
jgi:hypothetical protein